MHKTLLTAKMVPATILALAATKTMAQMVYEPFDYGTASVGTNLANLTGTPSFAGYVNPMNGQTWFDTNTTLTPSGPETQILAGNLASAGVAAPIGNSAFMQELGGASGGTARLAINPTGTTAPAVMFWSMSFEITDLTNLPVGGSFVAAFNNTPGTQTGNPTVIAAALQLKLDADGTSYDIGIRNGSSPSVFAPGKFTVGQEVFLVGEYNDKGGATDTSSIWVNPGSLGAGIAPTPSATVTAAGLSAGNSISSFILRTGNSAVPKGIQFDEIRIDQNWSQVTAPTGTTFSASAGGTWSNSANWSAGATNAPAAFAYFSGLATGSTVSLDVNQTAGSLTINNAAGVSITGPGTLTLDGGGGISGLSVVPVSNTAGNPTPASHSISAPIVTNNSIEASIGVNQTLTLSGGITSAAASAGITKNGAGTLILQGNSTYNAGVQINNGTLAVTSDSALGTAPTSPAVNVTLTGSGSVLRFDGSTSVNPNRTLNITTTNTSVGTNGNNVTWAGLISGSSLIKIGTGTLTLPDNGNSYSALFVSAGAVNISGDGALGAGGVQLQGGGLQLGAPASIGHAITVNTNNGSIDTNGNDASFSGAIRGAGVLTKKGTGNLTLTNVNMSASANTAGLNIAAGAVTVPQNGGNAVVLNTLTVGDNSAATTAKLDLNDNDLILNYVTGTSPIGTVQTLLAAGFNSGTWTGNGITSSVAASNPAANTGLGYAEATAVGINNLDGQSIPGNAVIVKYTYNGDTNLDGTVTTGDFQNFLDGFASGGSTWSQGDFTYDGKVDLGNDFNLFLVGFLSQGGALGELAPIINADDQLTASQKASLLAVVPEPSSVMAIALAAGGLAARRRRRTA